MENWKRLSHLFVAIFLSNFTSFLINPATADITVEAVCRGKEECSLAFYLTGFQQAITGLGAVVMMPLIGNLSDVYGRKTLLLIPLSLAIFPLLILACSRTTNFFYAYYAFRVLTNMVTEGGVVCLASAYLADNVSKEKRAPAFGVFSGVISVAHVCGTFAARLIPTSHTFQVAAGVSVSAVAYVAFFLEETRGDSRANLLQRPILEPETEENQSSKKVSFIRGISLSPRDIITLLKRSATFSLLAGVAFFNSLATAGIRACLMFSLKARFHFKKDQLADIYLIATVGSALSNFLVLPLLALFIREETLMAFGLFAGFLNMLLQSIAWSAWVPYAATLLTILFSLADPNLKSLVSKQIGPKEQGIAQGSISGITFLAVLISPLILTPISASFLSEDPPFDFPGFNFLCVGLAFLMGCILSIWIKLLPKRETVYEVGTAVLD